MNNRKMLVAALATVALLAVVGGTGCRRVPIESVDRPFGDAVTQTDNSSDKIALEGAESLTADVEMGAGVLWVDGAAQPSDTAQPSATAGEACIDAASLAVWQEMQPAECSATCCAVRPSLAAGAAI